MRLGRLSSCRSRGALREGLALSGAPAAPGFALRLALRRDERGSLLGDPLRCSPRRDVTRVRGPDELGRQPFAGRPARSARGSRGVWGTTRRRPRSHRPMSAAHDSILKTNAHSSRHTPRRFPTTREPSVHADGLASASRRSTARRVVPRDRVAVRTSDASSLRGLPGRTLPRPPARPAGRTRRPRVVPESLGLLPPCSVKSHGGGSCPKRLSLFVALHVPSGDPERTLPVATPKGGRRRDASEEVLQCHRPAGHAHVPPALARSPSRRTPRWIWARAETPHRAVLRAPEGARARPRRFRRKPASHRWSNPSEVTSRRLRDALRHRFPRARAIAPEPSCSDTLVTAAGSRELGSHPRIVCVDPGSPSRRSRPSSRVPSATSTSGAGAPFAPHTSEPAWTAPL